jgi:DNA-binding LytR/AlgR family response regulator
MVKEKYSWFENYFPQNYIIRNPLQGALIVALSSFIFTVLYRPLGSHGSMGLSYEATMAVYSLVAGASLYGIIRASRILKFLTDTRNWNFLKEILSIAFILTLTGSSIYLAAFVIEPPADRLNVETYMNSVSSVFLVGLLPFLFFTIMNYRYLLYRGYEPGLAHGGNDAQGRFPEEEIHINSSLKKESLSFYPRHLLFAESEGNYVVFHLMHDEKVRKEMIRNSIGNIEKQLSSLPFCVRTHRAFIVNMMMITKKQGNAAGYVLRIKGTDREIPVSRTHTKAFDSRYRQYRR